MSGIGKVTSTYVDVRREYRYYTDANNFEAIEWAPVGFGDIIVTWRAMGTGTHRRPECAVVGDVVEVRGMPIIDRMHDDPDAQVVVRGGLGKSIKVIP